MNMNDNSWTNFALTGAPMAYLLFKQRKGKNPGQEEDFSEANQSPRPRSS